MQGKIIINIDGDDCRVEMWKQTEDSVACCRFRTTTDALKNMNLLEDKLHDKTANSP